MQTPSGQTLNSVRRLADFFGLKRNLVVLLVAIFVIGAGEELWMRFVPKYLQALGASVFVIGLYDALRTLLGAIYAYPGGVLVDAWGHRHAFLVGRERIPGWNLLRSRSQFRIGRDDAQLKLTLISLLTIPIPTWIELTFMRLRRSSKRRR